MENTKGKKLGLLASCAISQMEAKKGGPSYHFYEEMIPIVALFQYKR